MVTTCGLSRLLSGGAMGYLGASPFHNPMANALGAIVGVGAVYGWTRWWGPATACEVPPRTTQDDRVNDDTPASQETI